MTTQETSRTFIENVVNNKPTPPGIPLLVFMPFALKQAACTSGEEKAMYEKYIAMCH